MNLLSKLRVVWRSFLDDLLSEEIHTSESPASPGRLSAAGKKDGSPHERLEALIEDAQVRIQALSSEHAEAAARQKHAETDWKETQNRADALDLAVDEALKAGQEELARSRLEEAQKVKRLADDQKERSLTSAQVTARLELAITELQDQVDQARQRSQALAERQRNVEALEQLERLEREMRRTKRILEDELGQSEEQISRLEDRQAARDELRGKV